VVNNFEVFIGAHGAATVVFFLANDVDFVYVERVGGTDDRADVKIVFNVFDGDFEGRAFLAEGFKNLFIR